jgi:hypothetical protein
MTSPGTATAAAVKAAREAAVNILFIVLTPVPLASLYYKPG